MEITPYTERGKSKNAPTIINQSGARRKKSALPMKNRRENTLQHYWETGTDSLLDRSSIV